MLQFDASSLGAVRVLVRIRPSLENERGWFCRHLSHDTRSVTLQQGEQTHRVGFDAVLGSEGTQQAVFELGHVDQMIRGVLAGFNACVFGER